MSVSAQPPRPPAPVDLARARPKPSPPKPSPPRSNEPQRQRQPGDRKRFAEAEKERARRALRALVSDQATDFAAMPADDFFDALKLARDEGIANPALIADCERRTSAGQAGPRELHQVLFPGPGTEAGTVGAWANACELAMAAVAGAPHDAVTVIGMEAQRAGGSGMTVTESTSGNGFAARAGLDRDGTRAEGDTIIDTSKKRARQRAALSLLSVLTRLRIPETADGRPSGFAGGSKPAVPADLTSSPSLAPPASHSSCAPSPAAGAAPKMTGAELESWLDYEITSLSPDPEFADAITPGNLTARSVYLLLFEAAPDGWRAGRAAAWQALAANPSLGPGVLSMYTQSRSLPPAVYASTGPGCTLACLDTPDGPLVGEHARAAGPKAARSAAATALIAALAPPAEGVPAPVPAPGPDAEGSARGPEPGSARSPVSVLNELIQTGGISGLIYTHEVTGPPHQPVFTCAARCAHSSGDLTRSARGRSKNAAKSAAAQDLLDHINAAERSMAHLPVPDLARDSVSAARSASLAQAGPGRGPAGVFARLLRAGCLVEFTGEEFRIGDPSYAGLPEPLAGWRVPLLGALPVLAALPVPGALPGDRDGTGAGASSEARPAGAACPPALAWGTAARTVLRAVAERRVYPALDAAGRDCWRLAPAADVDGAAAGGIEPDGVTAFYDAAANALLRPAGARLVVGDLPYAGKPRVLDGAAAEWADAIADATEATAPVPLVLLISPPTGDGQPLVARIHARDLDRAQGHGGAPGPGGTRGLGHAEYRLLRRAACRWPPLTRVRDEGTLTGAEAAALLGPAGQHLAAMGITVGWPARLVLPQAAVTVTGSGSGAFTLAGKADLTWRLTLDGEPLTDEETAEVAEAVAGLVFLRGHWVVIDDEIRRKAREPSAGRLSGAQALTAALTGLVTVAGQETEFAAAGRLASLITSLRAATDGTGGTDHSERDAAGGAAAGGSAADGAGDAAFAAPPGLRADLRGYQQRAVMWLDSTTSHGFGTLLADDMGLGKTLTVIAYLLRRWTGGDQSADGGGGRERAALVVCPASLLANWEREFARFAPDVPVRRYHGTGRQLGRLASGEVVITTYPTMTRDAAALAGFGWDVIVADEAQTVKNHRSRAAVALRSLPAAARVAVTGTPVENSLSELWAILDWANPGLFGTLAAFRQRYGRAAELQVRRGEDDIAAARRLSRLIAPFTLRRRKTDPGVAPELPDKVASDRYVQLTREQAALYASVSEAALQQVSANSGIERRGQVLRLLQALRQICNSPAHFLREDPAGWDAGAQAARSGKLRALDELLDAVAATGDAALIFTGYVSMGHMLRAHLAARGITADFLHGGVPVTRRQEIVDRFQSGEGTALILSVRAAGTGLNLTRAGHVIHFDRPWNPAVEDQATDRVHRIGQHRCVEVHHLIAEGTVEDRIAALLAAKRGLTEAVLAGGETALTELTDGELSALVSLGGQSGDREDDDEESGASA